MIDDSDYLQQALRLTRDKRGFCAPNPAVGAILVKDNQIIGQGVHEGPGTPHAEIVALQHASQNPKDSTLYVTLEPCGHWGRTPPCTKAIIEAGIKKVIYGHIDPNPAMVGKSAIVLNQYNIDCHHLILTSIESFYQSYDHWWQTGYPFVTFKIAMSLDGKIALANRERITLTGASVSQLTHRERFHTDAILTTAQTIMADNPYLTARHNTQQCAKPLYILDRTQQLKDFSRLNIWAPARQITIFFEKGTSPLDYGDPAIKSYGITKVKKGLNLELILKHIGQDGIQNVWVEAGGKLLGALLRQHLINRLYVYVAPKALGLDAMNAFEDRWDFLKTAKKVSWELAEDDCLLKIDF